jgi:hypothetical protein
VSSVYSEQEGKLLKKINVVLLTAFLLTGCSSLPVQLPILSVPTAAVLATVPAANTVVEPTHIPPTAAVTATPTMLVLPKIDPEKTVSLFLDGKKANADFALISKLLSANYASQLKDDAGLAAVFDPEAVIGEYKIGTPTYSADSQSATLDSTIYMPEPSNVRFTLVLENAEWKIDQVTVITTSSDYPTAPEGVVLGFLTSYQEAPDRMSSFLTATRRGQQPPGGASAMLQISGSLEGMVIQSAAVSPEPPTASIVVVIRAGGKDYPRKFILSKDGSGWGIDAIEVTGG